MNVSKRTISAIAAVSAILVVALTACSGAGAGGDGGGGSGDVEITGRLAGLVTGNRVGAPLGGSSLSSAVVTVGALPIIGGELDIEAVEETDVAGDGAFTLDVPTEPNIEHVFLVRAPEDGVGVEQGLGFIELPIGGEAAAGWDLSGSDGSTVDLGALSGSTDTFLADNAPQDLLDLLNVDQQELLFFAQRDGHLKATSNTYLNAEFNSAVLTTNLINGDLSGANGAWTTPQAAYSVHYLFLVELRFPLDSDLDFDAIESGSSVFEIVPPTDVVINETLYSPTNPIQLTEIIEQSDDLDGDGTPEPTGYELNFTVDGDFDRNAGPWKAVVDGIDRGAYDFDLTNPFDLDGNYLYFVPSLRVTVDGATDEVTGVEYRWFVWNPQTSSYELFTGDIADFYLGYGSTMIVLYFETDGAQGDPIFYFEVPEGEVLEIDEEIYWTAEAGQRQLTMIEVDDGLNFGALWGFELP